MNLIKRVLVDGSSEEVYVNCKNIRLSKGDRIIFSNNQVLFSGQVLGDSHEKSLAFLVRKASSNDLKVINRNKNDSEEVIEEAKKIIKKLDLDMNIVDSYYTFDRKQLYFLFVAESRVDFRQLVKKLAERYKTRIELRQIGIRDKAKRIGGIGPCGLFLCCNSFLTDFNSVSINMAKNQFLALNPTKINGLCGRLLCCLNYEDDQYTELKRGAPKLYSEYETDKGKGRVISIDIFKGTIEVEMPDKSVVCVTYRE